MKGLLLKDLYVLSRQMRVFLVIIMVFALLPGGSMSTFAIVYAAMLPYTAMAYDERSHWDQLAAAMPYSTWNLVLSKYALGWIFMTGAAVLTLAAGAAERALGVGSVSPATVSMSFCAGLLIMDITLPLMFRFSVERGRMFFTLLVVGAVVGASSVLGTLAAGPGAGVLLSRLLWEFPATAAAATLLSLPLSVRMYAKRFA